MGLVVLGLGRGPGKEEVPEGPWPGVDAGGGCCLRPLESLALLVFLRYRKHPREDPIATTTRTPITMPAMAPSEQQVRSCSAERRGKGEKAQVHSGEGRGALQGGGLVREEGTVP